MGVPYVAIVKSAANRAKYTAQAQALRRQNAILNQGAREQNRAGMEASTNFSDYLDQLNGNQVNPATEQAAFSAALGPESVHVLPTASGAARGDAAALTGDARGYGSNLASLFARIRAPQLQQEQNQEALMAMQNRMRPIQQGADNSAFLTSLRASQIKPKGFMAFAGNSLGGGS